MGELKTWDKYTNKRIKQLHPDTQERVFEFINACDKNLNIKLRVTDWFRTFKEQDEKYKKGRKTSGKIITYAKGGESYHNYGLASDVVEIKNGKALWKNPNWLKIGEMGEKYGFEWGGRWLGSVQKQKYSMDKQLELIDEGEGFDKPHFQMTFGLTINELKILYKIKKGQWVELPRLSER